MFWRGADAVTIGSGAIGSGSREILKASEIASSNRFRPSSCPLGPNPRRSSQCAGF